MEIRHQLDKTYLKSVLGRRGISQSQLAANLSENEKNLSRWIVSGYPANKLIALKESLELSADEFSKLLAIPEYRIFFRSKFLSDVPEESEKKALEWARVIFNSPNTSREKSIKGLDLSDRDNPKEIASTIKDFLGLPDGCCFDQYLTTLDKFGIEVVTIPFAAFGLQNSKEQAFSVFDGVDRYVIFLNSDCNKAAIVWNLCHEICHLFRVNAQQGSQEEKICQEVAKSILYPENYFELHRQRIELAMKNNESAIRTLFQIRDHFNGSAWSIAIILEKLKISKDLSKYLITVGRREDSSTKTMTNTYFPLLVDRSNEENIKRFWNEIDASNSFYRLFSRIKTAVTLDRMSTRKFSEITEMDLGFSTSLADNWRSEFDSIEDL